MIHRSGISPPPVPNPSIYLKETDLLVFCVVFVIVVHVVVVFDVFVIDLSGFRGSSPTRGRT